MSKLRDEAAQAGARLAAKGFQRWMDRYDQKPLFRAKLVRRFRRFFGLTTTAERDAAHAEMLRLVQKAADEYQARRK